MTTLQPLIDLCQRRRGAKAEALRRFKANTGRPCCWSQISGWLHPNHSKRTEPRFETGKALEKVMEEMLDEAHS